MSLYRFESTFCKQQNVLLNGTTAIHGESDAVDALRFAKASDVITYRDNTHVITDYRYDSFGRRIHTAERTKTGMRTIYDGLTFEVVKEAETFLGTRGITSSATGEANLNNYTPQVPQNGGSNNTAPSYGSDHTKGTRYYYIPNNAQGSQTRNNGETTQTADGKGTIFYPTDEHPQDYFNRNFKCGK